MVVGSLDGCLDPELRALARYLPNARRRVALDVGANNGMTTLALSRLFDTVYAFEPNPKLLSEWRDVAPRNVVAMECALSDAEGHAELLIPQVGKQLLDGWASLDRPGVGEPESFVRVAVASRTLDSFDIGQRPVDFVKIDVEGHELAVLAGARGLFTRWRPWVIIEAWDKNRAAVLDWFAGLEYERVDLLAEQRIVASPQNVVLRPK